MLSLPIKGSFVSYRPDGARYDKRAVVVESYEKDGHVYTNLRDVDRVQDKRRQRPDDEDETSSDDEDEDELTRRFQRTGLDSKRARYNLLTDTRLIVKEGRNYIRVTDSEDHGQVVLAVRLSDPDERGEMLFQPIIPRKIDKDIFAQNIHDHRKDAFTVHVSQIQQ